MPAEVGKDAQQKHPSKKFRTTAMNSGFSKRYFDFEIDLLQKLANGPYHGQYVNGYYQTNDPNGRSFLLVPPTEPLYDREILPQVFSRQRPADEAQGRMFDKPIPFSELPDRFRNSVQRFQAWNDREYQASDTSAPNYLSLRDFANVHALGSMGLNSWQSSDSNKPYYIPTATLNQYEALKSSHEEALKVMEWNLREASLADREANKRPWWMKIIGTGGDDQTNLDSSDQKRSPGWKKLVAAALVLLVIVVVVLLVKRNNDGHQKFSPQPTQGLWGYDWTASSG